MFQTQSKVILCCAVPALDRNSLKLSLSGERQVTIEGKIKEHRFAENREFIMKKERFCGKFIRRIPLPSAVHPEGYKTSYVDGILEICFTRNLAKKMGKKELKVDI
ncbi:hypothetical protein BSNK01_21840 [Bacillaceae bacterium]